tara:strand:+ start:977 stop:1177 length:201 start_codon:yes stop_codon:yes gene_type:complete
MGKDYNGDSSLIYTSQLEKDRKKVYNISINEKFKEVKDYFTKPKYDRVEFKVDAAQKIRDYFHSKK